jgi:hypothetical protein
MNKTKHLLIYFLTLPILLIGCGQKAKGPDQIAKSIEVIYDNSSEITLGTRISIWVKNTSAYCVEFPLSDGLSLYAYEKDAWIEIPNLVEFIGKQTITLMPNDILLSENQVVLNPDISSLSMDKPTKFYALLTGYLCDDKTVEIKKEIPFTLIP